MVILHQSEYVRRLLLSLSSDISLTLPPPDFISHTLSQLNTHLSPLLHDLVNTYKYYKTPCTSRNNKVLNSKLSQYSEGVGVPVRSLTLHLEAALLKCQEVEKMVEDDQDDVDAIKEGLNSCNKELQACVCCYDDALAWIEKPKQEVPKVDLSNAQSAALQASPGKVIPYEPYEVEDEVFEAWIAQLDDEYGAVSDSNDYDESLKKDTQNSRKMLKELKGVLVHKADEWKEREDKALKKKQESKTNAEDPVLSSCTVVENEGSSVSLQAQIEQSDTNPKSELLIDTGTERYPTLHTPVRKRHSLPRRTKPPRRKNFPLSSSQDGEDKRVVGSLGFESSIAKAAIAQSKMFLKTSDTEETFADDSD